MWWGVGGGESFAYLVGDFIVRIIFDQEHDSVEFSRSSSSVTCERLADEPFFRSTRAMENPEI